MRPSIARGEEVEEEGVHRLQGHTGGGRGRLEQSTLIYFSLVFGLIAAWLAVLDLSVHQRDAQPRR